jgi:hypothetical protein
MSIFGNVIVAILQALSRLSDWIMTPIYDMDNVPLGWLVLEKLGVNIGWIYNLSPFEIITGSLVAVLTIVLVVKIVKLVWDAIPIV